MTEAARITPQGWMTAPETRAVVAALSAEGAGPRFVGGCVRDALLGRPVTDVDLATPDPPETVMRLLERAAIKAVPTGLAHGTVTAVIAGRGFEVTTLRIDVETYGRHALVAFTDDWQADAARRDLTINALSCEPDGRLHDYFGGKEDLEAGRVRFVGAPAERIREDYLRLLRFFRFHAHYGRGPLDADGLAAAARLAPEARGLSGERVRAELFKLLAAADPVPVLAVMAEKGILPVFLPEAGPTAPLAALIAVEAGGPDVLLRLAALLRPEAEAAAVADRLRLSRAERERLAVLLGGWRPPAGGLGPDLYRLGAAAVGDLLRLDWARRPAPARRAAFEAGLADAAAWRPKAFPLKGRDGLGLGLAPGPRLGDLLARVEDWWIARDFAPDRAACLEKLKELAGA